MLDIPAPAETDSARVGIPPSEALTRFEPPAGFVPVAVEANVRRLRYGFRRAGFSLLIREGVGSEVVPMTPLASIPNGPAWLLGVMNLRGNLVPVCDLRQVLGEDFSNTSGEKPMILVLDKGEMAAAFVIDGYPVALDHLRGSAQVPGLPGALAQYVPAVYSTAEEVWLELDHEGFLEGSNKR